MNENVSLEELVELFLEQCRAGNAPDAGGFAARHPEHTARLMEILPLLQDMEMLGGGKTRRIILPASPLPELAGSDYHLLRQIGGGGMGVVFEALQISLDRKVAVKLLSAGLVADARQRGLFAQEARVIAMLHHPNIVKVLSAGNCADNYYYAMELIDGRGLDACEFATPREVAAAGLQAARALAYAHRCNVVHRDVKPANLLLDSNRTVHVSDFGLAFVLQHSAEKIEAGGFQEGTLRYMAPERLSRGVTSFASDQYSLGVTLYELITKSPFAPGRSGPLKCAAPDLAAIVNKGIRADPAGRYPSMEDFADDLQRFLNHEPVRAAPASFWRRTVLWARRKPAVAVLAVAASVCALAFVAALLAGYVRTASALALAERNASVADATLSNVFAHLESQVPTPGGTRLLATLTPYYQGIAEQRGSPPEKVAAANEIIGTYALRAGNAPLAEAAFRRLAQLRRDAFPLNQLAEALRRQGKTEAADALLRHVADRFAASENPADRFEAVRALETLSEKPDDAELVRAFQLIQSLLRDEPGNPEYQFQYAAILARNPALFRTGRIPSVEPNAVVLLNRLAGEHPERPEYGLALVDLMWRKLHYAQRFTDRDWADLDTALELSDQLLGRFPNTPQVVSSTVRLREAHAGVLRKNGDAVGARRETERLTGMLEILFHNPETPDEARECLLQLYFQRLERALRDGRLQDASRVRATLMAKLEHYNGARLAEFTHQLSPGEE